MKIIEYNNSITFEKEKFALGVGFFDGVHKGHMKLINVLKNSSQQRNLETCLLIIEPPAKIGQLLTTRAEKLSILKNSGINCVIFLSSIGLNPEQWLNWSAEYFIEEFIKKTLGTRFMVAGEDFRFGKGRLGNTEYIKNHASEKFDVFIVDLEADNGRKISSSIIRDIINTGDLKTAAELLGRNYFFQADTISGRALGRSLGFPTINFKIPQNKLIPSGVFYAKLFLTDGNSVNAACFSGKPFGADSSAPPTVELHILDYTENICEQIEKVELIEKIRDTQNFSSETELKSAIKNDIIYIHERISSV